MSLTPPAYSDLTSLFAGGPHCKYKFLENLENFNLTFRDNHLRSTQDFLNPKMQFIKK